jgi:hypothetical protein
MLSIVLTKTMQQSTSSEAKRHPASQIPNLSGTRRLITVFAEAYHWSQS